MRALALNLQKGLRRYGIPWFEQSIREAQESGEERYLTEADIKRITDDVIHGNFVRLADSVALTGEWLIYAEHDGRKYYLGLGTHDVAHHDNLRHQIDALCCHEFPFLRELLTKA